MKNFFDKKKKAEAYKPRPTLYRAKCDKCNSACEVPFQPTGQRPVYCRDCFRTTDANFFDKKPSFNNAPHPNSSNNEEVVKQLKALNTKMDQLLEALSEFEVDVEEDEDR